MCRFLAYTGPQLLLADLIVYPKHSLIDQSYESTERFEPMNGDGFGVGWYNPELSPEPGIFVATTPAWSNRNLRRLAEKILSPLIFAHVRAASSGMSVNELNCHPFQHSHLMWMHNGRVDSFLKIKRTLRTVLRDDLYNFIQGTTDSEHAFALFLNFLPRDLEKVDANKLKKAMLATIAQLNEWTNKVGAKDASYYNFAVTDGETIIATRYTNQPDIPAETLYFSRGERYICDGDVCRVIPVKDKPRAVVVASEPLTPEARWEPIPINHMLIIDKHLRIKLEPIQV
jgi:glutamine amidotransferase